MSEYLERFNDIISKIEQAKAIIVILQDALFNNKSVDKNYNLALCNSEDILDSQIKELENIIIDIRKE